MATGQFILHFTIAISLQWQRIETFFHRLAPKCHVESNTESYTFQFSGVASRTPNRCSIHFLLKTSKMKGWPAFTFCQISSCLRKNVSHHYKQLQLVLQLHTLSNEPSFTLQSLFSTKLAELSHVIHSPVQ